MADSPKNQNQGGQSQFPKSTSILVGGNVERFLPLVSKKEVIEVLNPEEYNTHQKKLIADMFQSITTEGKFTHEIVKEYNELTKKFSSKEKKKVKSLFRIVYTTSGKTTRPNVKDSGPVLNIQKSELLLDRNDKIGRPKSDLGNNETSSNYKMEDLCVGISELINYTSKSRKTNFNFMNKGVPSKRTPHFSAIMINDPSELCAIR